MNKLGVVDVSLNKQEVGKSFEASKGKLAGNEYTSVYHEIESQ